MFRAFRWAAVAGVGAPLGVMVSQQHTDIHAKETLPRPTTISKEQLQQQLEYGKMVQVAYDIFNNNSRSVTRGNTILVGDGNLKELISRMFDGYRFDRRLRTVPEYDPGDILGRLAATNSVTNNSASFMGFILRKEIPDNSGNKDAKKKEELVIVYRGTNTLDEGLKDMTQFTAVWNHDGDGIGCDLDDSAHFDPLHDYLQLLLPYSWMSKLFSNLEVKVHRGFKSLYIDDRDASTLNEKELARVCEKAKMSKESFLALTEDEKVAIIVKQNNGMLEGPRTRIRKVVDKMLEEDRLGRVVMTGHSLGASLAVVTALDIAEYIKVKQQELAKKKQGSNAAAPIAEIPVEAVTFACPKVGNYRFIQALDDAKVKHYHHHNQGDFVPHLGLFARFHSIPSEHYIPFRYTSETIDVLDKRFDASKSIIVSLIKTLFGQDLSHFTVFHKLELILYSLCTQNVHKIERDIAYINKSEDFLDPEKARGIPPRWLDGLLCRVVKIGGKVREMEADVDEEASLIQKARVKTFIDSYVELHKDNVINSDDSSLPASAGKK